MADNASKAAGPRDIYSINYDQSKCLGDTVHGRFENAANDDVSVVDELNDGTFTVSVAAGYKGEDNVTVHGSDGGSDGPFSVVFDGKGGQAADVNETPPADDDEKANDDEKDDPVPVTAA